MFADEPWESAFQRSILHPIRRVWKNGAFFLKLSSGRGSLQNELSGKSVAIVGNSRALSEHEFGADIDEADIVVRINKAPIPNTISHGQKTSWLALAVALSEKEGSKIAPERVMWLSPKRKRLPFWVANSPGFFLFPVQDFRELRTTIGAPPTTGLMIIDFVRKSNAKLVTLYGFDFFSSLSLSGSRTEAQVPHDFGAEKIWVEAQMKRDRRITLVK